MSAARTCPFCGQQSADEPTQFGATVICNRCGRQFTLSDAIFTPPVAEPKLAPLEARPVQSFQTPHRLLVESEKDDGPQISTSTALIAVGLLIGAMLIFVCGFGGLVLLRILRDR